MSQQQTKTVTYLVNVERTSTQRHTLEVPIGATDEEIEELVEEEISDADHGDLETGEEESNAFDSSAWLNEIERVEVTPKPDTADAAEVAP